MLILKRTSNKINSFKYLYLIIFLFILSMKFSHTLANDDKNNEKKNHIVDHDMKSFENIDLLPNCDSVKDENNNSNNVKNYLIAATLNGKISIINAVWGTIKWTKQIQTQPLISSTIGDVMKIHNGNGELMQILPSLDGNIYVYHGDTIKKTQFSAEKLLKNSFKLNENIMLAGGQESKLVGFDIENGDVIYDCGHAGCSHENESTTSMKDVVLLRKNSQSVRAINTLTGHEEWHFVVDDPQIVKVGTNECRNQIKNSTDTSPYQIQLKVMLPYGRISTLVHYTNDSSQSEIFNTWTIDLDSPIVNMWHYQNNDLVKINLFDPNINFFSTLIAQNDNNNVDHSTVVPYLYLGSYNNNYYLQTSSNEYMNQLLPYYDETGKIERKQSFIAVEDIDTEQKQLSKSESSTELAPLKRKRFPFLHSKLSKSNASGFLVLNFNKNNDQCSRIDIKNRSDDNDIDDDDITVIVYAQLSYYWKEILCICMMFSVTTNTLWCLLKKYWSMIFSNNHRNLVQSSDSEINDNDDESSENSTSSNQNESKQIIKDNKEITKLDSSNETMNFKSRYMEDFEQLSLLGKGGFGLVFEAKHKIDESHYAVKRIALPSNGDKRQRFMREIRALSKLDHVNIVRYYNAWIEEPPNGWQEQQDRQYRFENFSSTNSMLFSSTTTSVTTTTHRQLMKSNEISFNDDYIEDVNNNDDSLEIVFEEEEIQRSNNNNSLKIIDNNDEHKIEVSSRHENNYYHSRKMTVTTRTHSHPKKHNHHRQVPKSYVYIQMQLCRKETLKDWLFQNLQRTKTEIINIFIQLLKAVNYVHNNNLIHRDLKPSNIFFSMDGLVKIGDFGLVTTIVEEDDFEENGHAKQFHSMRKHHQNYLKHTNRVGTQLYMSPEQIRNQPYDHKVDIYSMGIILYELLVSFNTESERIHHLQNVRLKKFPKEFDEKYSEEKKIIEKMMADSPVNRPESMDLLLHDLFKS